MVPKPTHVALLTLDAYAAYGEVASHQRGFSGILSFAGADGWAWYFVGWWFALCSRQSLHLALKKVSVSCKSGKGFFQTQWEVERLKTGMTTGSRWRIRVTCVGLLDGLFHGPSSYSTLTFKWSKIGFFCGHHSPHTSSIRQIYTLPQKRQGIGLKVCLFFFFVLAGCRSCGGTMFFFWGGACFTYQ